MSRNVPILRFKDYRDDLNKVKLGDLIKIVRGGSPRPIKDYMTQGEGYNWIKISDADVKSKYIYGTAEKMKAEGLNRTRLIKPGSLLLSNSMSFGRPYISKIEGCIHDGWLLLEPNEDSIDKNYLVQILSSETISKQYKMLAAGSTVNNLNIDLVSGVEVHLPSKNEQTKIADFLSVIDSRITNQSSKLDTLQELKEGIMQKIFSQEIRFKREDEGEYPSWKSEKLEDAIERFATGLNPRNNFKLGIGDNKYITIKNIKNGKLICDNYEAIDDTALGLINKRSDLRANDILFTSIGDIGNCYVIQDEPKKWNINESVFSLRPNMEKVIPMFVYYTIINKDTQLYFDLNITGSTFKSIKMRELKLTPFPIPCIEEQQKIADFLSTLDSRIDLETQILSTLQTLKKGLLQQMFV